MLVLRTSLKKRILVFSQRMISEYSKNNNNNNTPKSKIYTKTGDEGKSSLFSGERRKKNDIIFNALGTVDELNAHLGLSYEHSLLANNDLHEYISEIQSRLFDIGAHIAVPRSSSSEAKKFRTEFDEQHLINLESWIDHLDSQLPPLKNFILPSGGLCAAQLHVTRAVSRRAERILVDLLDDGEIDSTVYKYVNRLSDFLFVAARYSSMKEGKQEVIYKKSSDISKKSEIELIKQPSCFTKTVRYTPFEVKEVKNYGLVDMELINNEISQWMNEINNYNIESALEKYRIIIERLGSSKHFDTCKMLYEKVNEYFGYHKDFVEIYISFLLRVKMRNLAEKLFFELRNDHNVKPSKELYLQIIQVSGQLKDKGGIDLLYNSWKEDFIKDEDLYEVTILAYAKAKAIDDAVAVYDQSKVDYPENLNLAKVMLRAFCSINQVEKGTREIINMQMYGPKPDLECFHILMYCAASNGNYGLVEKLYNQIQGYNLTPDSTSWNILIYSYLNADKYDSAKDSFLSMIGLGFTPTIETISLLLRASVKNKEFAYALEYYNFLIDHLGVQPDIFIYSWTVEASVKLNDFKKCFEIVDRMIEEGIPLKYKFLNLLRTHCIKKGYIEEFEKRYGAISESIKSSYLSGHKNKGEKYEEILRIGGYLDENVLYKDFNPKEWKVIDDAWHPPSEKAIEKRREKERSIGTMKMFEEKADEVAKYYKETAPKSPRELKREIDEEKRKIEEQKKKEEARKYRESKPKFTFR